MRSQPGPDYLSSDDVVTPPSLARAILEHLRPSGRLLEPCCGSRDSFLQFMPGADWCEITRGRDFFAYGGHVDWIITNPPWSKIRSFLSKAMRVADNVAFLITINHVWTKARLRDVTCAGFHIAEIVLCPSPREFPSSGFQLGVVLFRRGPSPGSIKFSTLSWVDYD